MNKELINKILIYIRENEELNLIGRDDKFSIDDLIDAGEMPNIYYELANFINTY